MLYFTTSGILVALSLLLKKSERKQNALRSLIMAIIAYECYLCLLAGVLTTLHIPVSAATVSVCNICCIVGTGLLLYKQKQIQSYFVDYKDMLFLLFLGGIIAFLFIQRFTPDMDRILFGTSDPATHLKMAMNFIHNKAVDGMYIGQLINGLFIDSMRIIFSDELIYKSFLIQYGFNFFLSGAMLWAVLQKYQTGAVMRLFVYAVTIAYTLGYPYNDFLYGFVYLQMTITVICYLIGLMQDFMEKPANIWVWGIFTGAGCLAVSIGYTLLAPPVYLSILGLVAYKAHQEKWLTASRRFLFSRRFLLCALNIFFIPCFLTIWIIFVLPAIHGSLPSYGFAMSATEGAIYRNFFSDFLLFVVPAIYGIVSRYKLKKVSLLSFLWPIFGVYYTLFLTLMLSGKITTYYFYKLNYLLWMLLICSFTVGMHALWKKEKALFVILISPLLLLTGIYSSGFEEKLREADMNRIPFADSAAFFRVYAFNTTLQENSYLISDGLIDICSKIHDAKEIDSAVFIGYWQDLYWYEALTDQRFDGLHFYTYTDLMERFQAGEYGAYAVIQKKKTRKKMKPYRDYIDAHLIYENKDVWLIQRNERE